MRPTLTRWSCQKVALAGGRCHGKDLFINLAGSAGGLFLFDMNCDGVTIAYKVASVCPREINNAVHSHE